MSGTRRVRLVAGLPLLSARARVTLRLMRQVAFEIAIIFLLLIANGVFAMAEIAVVSSKKARLRRLADQGNGNARIALELAEVAQSLSLHGANRHHAGRHFRRRVRRRDAGGRTGRADWQISLPRALRGQDRLRHRGRGHHLLLAGDRGAGAEAVWLEQPGRHRHAGGPTDELALEVRRAGGEFSQRAPRKPCCACSVSSPKRKWPFPKRRCA